MSGDVQPRKRKDKRRKKEGGSLGSIHEPVASHKFRGSDSEDKKIFDIPDQGEKIHIQNEHGIGGNICVKIIFFFLFVILIGAVSLIYIQSQGSTDVDLPSVEDSRFAEYFAGWLDDSTDDHETHEHKVEDHDHEDDHDEHDEHDELDEHEEHERDEEEHESEEDGTEQFLDPLQKFFGVQQSDDKKDGGDDKNEEENNSNAHQVEESQESEKQDAAEEDDDFDEDEGELVNDNQMEEDSRDEEDNDGGNENKNDGESEEDKDADENDCDEDSGVELDKNEVDNDDDEEDKGDDEDDKKYDDDDEDEYDASQVDEDEDEKEREDVEEEEGNKSDGDTNDNDDENDEENKEGDAEDEENESAERDEVEKQDEEEEGEDAEEDESKEIDELKSKSQDDDDLGYDVIEDSEEDLEERENTAREENDDDDSETVTLDYEKTVSKLESESDIAKEGAEEEEEEEQPEAGGVAVKLGVGIALIIVAHLVLVQKWKSRGNVPPDETTGDTVAGNEITDLSSQTEPVISRRQTLVPENVRLGGEFDEEGEEEEEEEGDEEEEDENSEYSEEVEEEVVKKTESQVEKPSLKMEKDDYEEEIEDVEEEEEEEEGEEEEYEDERNVDNKEKERYVEDEEEYAEEEEEVEEEEDEEVEEEDEEEDDDDDNDDDYKDDKEKYFNRKSLDGEEESEKEENEREQPIPPPRANRNAKGGNDVEEEDGERVEENEVETQIQKEEVKVEEVREASRVERHQVKPRREKVETEEERAFLAEFGFPRSRYENNPKAGIRAYDRVLTLKPDAVKILALRAHAYDELAELMRSNAYLRRAITEYKSLLYIHRERLDDDMYLKVSERCINRMRFVGDLEGAIGIQKALIRKFPNNSNYRNDLAVTYLMMNSVTNARKVLNETLSLWPENGFALVHYGFILKTSDNNMEDGAKFLMAGINTREEGVVNGMFFFHLGDALHRLGRGDEAMEWYDLGVKEGLFLSRYQRSLYNVDRLKGQPWWTKEETTYEKFFRKLERNWRQIRNEGLALLNEKGVNFFKKETENLKDTGDWRQLDLYFRGEKQPICDRAPLTCSLVSSFKPASTCTRGQIKFSVMHPNTHVWPHCGPTNCRLRSHLGLVIPNGTYIRVAEETRSWEEGKFLIFDDSFEHEVWHNGTGTRLVLIIDVWHPELTDTEQMYLSPI